MNEPRRAEPTKAEWRVRLLAERAAVPVGVHTDEARALAESVRSVPGVVAGATVCCYLPFRSEPGSLGVLESLVSMGSRVLLPVVPETPGPLDWAEYAGASFLVGSRLPGLREPAGRRLGPATIARAALILVPALAVDYDGVRLGRGAGYYDRSLLLTGPDAEIVAVVRDSELVPKLPRDPHDVLMTGVLTPGSGLRPLPRSRTSRPV